MDQKEHRQIYPQPGWVEHDPLEIWERTREVMRNALEKGKISAGDIAAIGITNQRETTVVWEKSTGKPVGNAIVWQDTRTDSICSELAREGGPDRLRPIDRPAAGDLFFRAEDQMDPGQRPRSARAKPKRASCSSAIWIPG